MKKIILVIGSLLFFLNSNTQEFIHEFGKTSVEDFNIQKYAKDTSAEALVLYDIGKSYFIRTDEGFKMVFEHKFKIKVFKKSGLKWAQIEIPYYEKDNDLEKITRLEGNTYNFENGQIKKSSLDTKNTFVEKIDDNWRLKKFAMPDVKEGSVFEVSYELMSPYFFNFRSWEFQKEIPVVYSEYTTKMIPFYEYTYILQGAKKLDSYKKYEEFGIEQTFMSIKYQNMNYEFVMKDVPAFKDESFITSPEDYLIKMDFQLSAIHRPDGSDEKIMTTWPKLIEDLLDHEEFGKYLKNSQKRAKEIMDTMQIKGMIPNREKAETIEKYIKRNFNWNGRKDKFSSKSVKEFIKSKVGNSADINLFYTGMLREAGFEAYPVIISTRDNGKIKLDYPFEHFFNYIVVTAKIDTNYFILDATEPLSKFSEVPTRCFNDKGLIINKGKTDWVNFGSINTSYIAYDMEINPVINSDSLNINFQISASGYDALNLRKKYISDVKKLKSELNIDNFVFTDSISINNLTQIENPFEIKFNALSGFDVVEDKILIAPFLGLPVNVNPFTLPLRNYPIDMVYKKKKVFTATIHIPDGYKVLSKPENMTINNDLVKIQYTSENNDSKTLKIQGMYEFKKDVYGISNYIDIKIFFRKIIDKFNEKIILAKQ